MLENGFLIEYLLEMAWHQYDQSQLPKQGTALPTKCRSLVNMLVKPAVAAALCATGHFELVVTVLYTKATKVPVILNKIDGVVVANLQASSEFVAILKSSYYEADADFDSFHLTSAVDTLTQ